jgi:APA family basic amino acid/polyamine antiporter
LKPERSEGGSEARGHAAGVPGSRSEPRPGARSEAGRHPRDRLLRELSLADATFLVVASVIGSGIFLTPGRIADLLPHAGLFLAVWVAGGLLSLAGALANAELGAMFPHAGGDYVYLREAFHPVAGFLVGWLSFFVIQAGTVATLATGFSAGLAELVPLSSSEQIVLAVVLVLGTSLLNFYGVRHGARANNVTSFLKIAALVLFVVAGLATGRGDVARLATSDLGSDAIGFSAFGLALSPVLFSYLGWNASVYVASEIRDPARNVPRSLFVGLAFVIAIYLAVNALYLYAVPLSELRHSANAGEGTAAALFGPVSGTLVAVLVLISILGTLNATILVTPRIAYAMALDGLFFAGVDRVHARHKTPATAIGVLAAASLLLVVVLRSFPSVLDYTTFAILIATIGDTAALYALRRKAPDRPRPYRAWGYPIVPALYILANAAIAVNMLIYRPRECGIGLATLALGLPFYWWFVRRSHPVAAGPA